MRQPGLGKFEWIEGTEGAVAAEGGEKKKVRRKKRGKGGRQ